MPFFLPWVCVSLFSHFQVMRSNHADEYVITELNPVEWTFDDCPKVKLVLMHTLAVSVIHTFIFFFSSSDYIRTIYKILELNTVCMNC